MGRPKGKKDSKPRKDKRTPAQRSQASKKAAETKRLNAEKKQSRQAGDNPEFEAKLEQLAPEKQDQPAEVPIDLLLSIDDVKEWVHWPFTSWAQFNHLADLKLNDDEAKSLAGPLTNILNRHGIGEVIPPDMLDGLKIAGRLSPIMIERFKIIRAERKKRQAEQGSPDNKAGNVDQGRSTPANFDPEGQD